jgi:hypothetical protein
MQESANVNLENRRLAERAGLIQECDDRSADALIRALIKFANPVNPVGTNRD